MALPDYILRSSKEEARLYTIFNRMFVTQQERQNDFYDAASEIFERLKKNSAHRAGLHGSAIANCSVADWCYRAFALDEHWPGIQEDAGLNAYKLWLEGWMIHVKWQALFTICGYAVGVEKRMYDPRYELYFTPDVDVIIQGVRYLIEIKSANSWSFKSQVDKNHPYGFEQNQLYMHERGIGRGISLIENKNTQEFAIWAYPYNLKLARTHVTRLENIVAVKQRVAETKKFPKLHVGCDTMASKRALLCGQRENCFAVRAGQLKLA